MFTVTSVVSPEVSALAAADVATQCVGAGVDAAWVLLGRTFVDVCNIKHT